MALLRYLDDKGRLETRALDSQRFVVGRAATCQLAFDSDMISREHMAIQLESDGRFRIRDLESRNKTYVNGELITDTLLSGGDIIRAGDRVLEFIDDTTVPSAPDRDFLARDKGEPPNTEWVKTDSPIAVAPAQLEHLARIVMDQPVMIRAEDIAEAALSQILLDAQAERGFLALRAGNELIPIAQRGLARELVGARSPVNQSFAVAPLVHAVAGRYPQTTGQLNHKLGYAVTAVTAPLRHHGEVIGVLYLDRVSAKKAFAAEALCYALAAGSYIGALIGESAHRLKTFAPRDGLAWMNHARRVHKLLSTPIAATGMVDVSQKLFPGRFRCGDFADLIHIDEQRCAIVLIDTGGHGVIGMAQGYAIRAAFHAALTVSTSALTDPASVFAMLNRMIAQHGARQEIGCLFIGLDLQIGALNYVNAGVAPPRLLSGPGQVIVLDRSSLTLGADVEYVYEPARAELPSKFRLVCATHGLLEATNTDGEPFSARRLDELLEDRHAFDAPASMVAKIGQTWLSHLGGASPDEDATILAAGRD